MHDTTFPIEIYARIIRQTDRSDLVALLRVSRMINHEAERELYRCIQINRPHQGIHQKYVGLLTQLSQKEYLLAYVRQFDATFFSYMQSNRSALGVSLQELYFKMPNLEVLLLELYWNPDLVPSPRVPFRIRELYLTVRAYIHQDTHIDISNFLAAQTELVVLTSIGENHHPLPPTALPNLRILQCSPKFLSILGSGRNITHWRQLRGWSEALDPATRFPTHSLKYFFVSDWDVGFLSMFEEGFPALEYFEISLDSFDPTILRLPNEQASLDPIIEQLKATKMPSLRILKFIVQEYKLPLHSIKLMFDLYPRLEFVDTYSSDRSRRMSGPDDGDEAERWFRGRSSSEVVHWNDPLASSVGSRRFRSPVAFRP